LPELFSLLFINQKQFFMESADEIREYNNTVKEKDSPLYEFFRLQLQDIYWTEQQLITALSDMQKAATNEDLRQQFGDHLVQTERHISRLDEIFGIMGIKPVATKCEAMDELIKEGQAVIKETEKGSSTRDAALIMAAQKAEHYEIATYGGLVQFATSMGFERITSLLDQTLQEEKDADLLLSDIAEKKVNWLAETEDKV
jgi:ferritin-like metal-binding protein YciE